MADQRDQGISWTDCTWNPVRGCSRVSQGCVNCYAERFAARFSGPGMPYEGLARTKTTIVNNEERDPGNKREARWTGEVRIVPEHLADPLRWRRPRRVFVNSMSDLFHEKLTNEEIAAVFGVMAAAPRHTFQVLTKRPERMREWFRWLLVQCSNGDGSGRTDAEVCRDFAMQLRERGSPELDDKLRGYDARWPLPNVWLGVSVEDQKPADERIPHLLTVPAAVRFISAEPLLGPIDLERIDATKAGWRAVNGFPEPTAISSFGKWQEKPMRARLQNGLDWVIVGGESGPGARPMHPYWARSLRDQCVAAGVPFHFKQVGEWSGVGPENAETKFLCSCGTSMAPTLVQLGEHPCTKRQEGCVTVVRRVGKKAAGRELDGRTWDEFPTTGGQR